MPDRNPENVKLLTDPQMRALNEAMEAFELGRQPCCSEEWLFAAALKYQRAADVQILRDEAVAAEKIGHAMTAGVCRAMADRIEAQQ